MLQALLRIRRFCRSVGLSEAFLMKMLIGKRNRKERRETLVRRSDRRWISPPLQMYLLEEIFEIFRKLIQI